MGRLFGTDGARGVANVELTCEMALNIGRAAAMVLTNDTHTRPRIVIGKDTRKSSDMIESALAAGICSVGADVLILGVVPTPAIAYLVDHYKADAGMMISASHNPCEFNGIKLFNGDGYKLPDELEEKIENIVLDQIIPYPQKIGGEVGKTKTVTTAGYDYIEHIIGTCPTSLEGLKVALDCSNGSACKTAKKLFELLGAQVYILSCNPDGVNINANCGSTHMEALKEFTVAVKCDLGLAFDGDADRCLAVDENGQLVDGDQLIAICANEMKKDGTLRGNTAVVTVMSNMGFFKSCEDNGINVSKTKVGDRYVLEEMLEKGYCIGGEQSGHIIFTDYAKTGDGQLTGVQLMKIMKQTGRPLSELAKVMDIYPQVLQNIKVSAYGKARFNDDAEVKDAISKVEKELGGNGRILVRISGTEPLIRVMLEGKDTAHIKMLCDEVSQVIKERLV